MALKSLRFINEDLPWKKKRAVQMDLSGEKKTSKSQEFSLNGMITSEEVAWPGI